MAAPKPEPKNQEETPMTGKICCENDKWSCVINLDYMAGDFRKDLVTDLSLHQCRSCHTYRLEVERNERPQEWVNISSDRGDRMVNADRKFWKYLQSNFRS